MGLDKSESSNCFSCYAVNSISFSWLLLPLPSIVAVLVRETCVCGINMEILAKLESRIGFTWLGYVKKKIMILVKKQ